MKERIIKHLEAVAKKKGCEEVVLNLKEKKPLVLEGIKGSFIPEVLCYVKGQLRALITFIESLDEIEEFYKLTLFIDFTRKNSLFLYIVYDQQNFSTDEIIQKLTKKGVKVPENTSIVGVNL